MTNLAREIREQYSGATVVERGRNYIRHQLADGRFALDTVLGPLHIAGTETEIDTAWQATGGGAWQYEMVQADYHSFSRGAFNAGDLLQFAHPGTGEWVIFDPQSINWVNQDNSRQQIAIKQTVATVVEDDVLRWPAGYGPGRHYQYQAQSARIQKLITIDSASALPTATVTGTVWFEAEFVIKNSAGVELWIDGTRWARTNNSRVTTAGRIEFRSEATGAVLWELDYPRAWDSAGSETVGQFELRRSGANHFVTVRIPKAWMDAATYPVYVDPTLELQIGASANDAHEPETQWTFGYTDANVNVVAAPNDFDRWQGGFRFANVTIPAGATIDAATVELYKVTTADVRCIVYAENVDNALDYATLGGVVLRPKTASSVAWTASGAVGFYTSGDVKSVVQEVVNRTGWASGNALNIILAGTVEDSLHDGRVRAYDGDSTQALQLHVEYSEGGGSPYTITADAGPFALTGIDATLIGPAGDHTLTANTGSFALTGVSATLQKAVPTTETFNASGTFTAPAGVTSVTVVARGGGGGGGNQGTGTARPGGGGGGGGYIRATVAVTPGNTYDVTVGASVAATQTGNPSQFVGDSTQTATASGGSGTSTRAGGAGGAGSVSGGATQLAAFTGGSGGTAANTNNNGGAGGGEGAGSTANGGDGQANSAATGGAGGTGTDGGDGGAGGDNNVGGSAGTAPGGGGGGSGGNATSGGAGAAGQVTVTYLVIEQPSSPSMDAGSGTFALTGVAANLLAGRKLTADAGTLALSGNDATLVKGRRAAAEVGEFAYTGQDAGLTVARTVSAEVGEYALSGNDVGLVRGYRIAADAGSYTLAGIAAQLLAARLLGAAVGAFTLTGMAATLTFEQVGAYTLTVDAGTFALAGVDATLTYAPVSAYTLNAATGTFTLTGLAAGVYAARLVTADAGSYTLTGVDATLIYAAVGAYSIGADAGSFALTGPAAGLLATRSMAAALGTFAYTGNAALLVRGRTLAALTGVYALSGEVAQLVAARRLAVDAGTYALTGHDAVVVRGFVVAAQSGGFVLSGEAVALLIARLMAAGTGVYAWTGYPATVRWSNEYVTTPDARIFVVPLENRAWVVAAESRSVSVAAESRIFTVE